MDTMTLGTYPDFHELCRSHGGDEAMRLWKGDREEALKLIRLSLPILYDPANPFRKALERSVKKASE